MFYAMSGQNFIAKSFFLPYNIENKTIIHEEEPIYFKWFRQPATERGNTCYNKEDFYIC
jgi:hypothetical protein